MNGFIDLYASLFASSVVIYVISFGMFSCVTSWGFSDSAAWTDFLKNWFTYSILLILLNEIKCYSLLSICDSLLSTILCFSSSPSPPSELLFSSFPFSISFWNWLIFLFYKSFFDSINEILLRCNSSIIIISPSLPLKKRYGILHARMTRNWNYIKNASQFFFPFVSELPMFFSILSCIQLPYMNTPVRPNMT